MIELRTRVGTVRHESANMKEVAKVVSEWEQSNPQPTPPLVRSRWAMEDEIELNDLVLLNPDVPLPILKSQVESRLKLVPNIHDLQYKAELAEWFRKQFVVKLDAMWSLAARVRVGHEEEDYDVWVNALSTDADTVYKSISKASELTSWSIWEWIDEQGYTYKNRPFREVWEERQIDSSGVGDPLLALAEQFILSCGQPMIADEFSRMDIPQQVRIFSRSLVKEWKESWAIEDAQTEAELKRQSKQTYTGGTPYGR